MCQCPTRRKLSLRKTSAVPSIRPVMSGGTTTPVYWQRLQPLPCFKGIGLARRNGPVRAVRVLLTTPVLRRRTCKNAEVLACSMRSPCERAQVILSTVFSKAHFCLRLGDASLCLQLLYDVELIKMSLQNRKAAQLMIGLDAVSIDLSRAAAPKPFAKPPWRNCTVVCSSPVRLPTGRRTASR